MAQPPYVHLSHKDSVRPVSSMPVARHWRPGRAAELARPGQPRGPMFGVQGPDQGFALRLAQAMEHEVVLAPGESMEDATAGCVEVAMARAGFFGRAPVIYDVEHAFTLFGFLGGVEGPSSPAPDDLVKYRSEWFRGCAHDYWARLAIVSMVPEETLRLSPSEVRERLSEWSSLLK